MNDRIVGHYRILEKIGAGSMGEVFRAKDERLGRDVALKLIRSTSSGNPDHLRRFEFEARAAAALNHPNIVAVYDVGSDQGVPYIVCELLEGETLRQRLRDGQLPLRLALDYAQQIVQGLTAAHERRITHRDLKPENLFVTTDGRVKILDFGVAKLHASPEESGRSVEDLTTVTKHGAVIGTVSYMSPEQLRAKPADHRSDIFSVGAMLYEMLTGTRPFRGETEADTMTAVLRESPTEIELDKAGIPEGLRQIVGHCLEKEPEKRFQSARDLGFALETLQVSPSRRFGWSRISKSNPLPWALAAVLFVAAATLLLWRLEGVRSGDPSYHRITFEEGTIFSARFTPDFRSIIYGASWNRQPLQLYSTVGDSMLAQPLNIPEASLLSISRTGELALALRGTRTSHLLIENGTLARAPLAGGSPREILDEVSWADWDSNGELAVVHRVPGHQRIEYPIGHVLYQSEGWISHIRFSPKADKIAFINHPVSWDDRGTLEVVELAGSVHKLHDSWDSAAGVAWAPDGREIWFTAAHNGYARALLASDLKGRLRTVLTVPSGMTLQDIAPDGRVLVSLDAERLAMATAPRDGKSSNISWHDWDVAKDISRDGRSILFEDASEAAGSNYSVAIRKFDGTPPIRLGEGSAGGLSPDGKWAIAILKEGSGRVLLLPVGPGQARGLPITGLEQIENGNSRFLPDGKHITLDAHESGHAVRCYVVDVDSGKPVAVTPEGITCGLVSPDGKQIIAKQGDVPQVFSLAGGEAHTIPGLEPGFVPLQWSEDGSSIYAYRPGEIPAGVYKISLLSGAKTLIQELQPETSAGLVTVKPVVTTRDGSRFAYSYYQVLSVLYVISGLK
jgi:serine/threonine protein kinase/Tol biopolymer transport system component